MDVRETELVSLKTTQPKEELKAAPVVDVPAAINVESPVIIEDDRKEEVADEDGKKKSRRYDKSVIETLKECTFSGIMVEFIKSSCYVKVFVAFIFMGFLGIVWNYGAIFAMTHPTLLRVILVFMILALCYAIYNSCTWEKMERALDSLEGEVKDLRKVKNGLETQVGTLTQVSNGLEECKNELESKVNDLHTVKEDLKNANTNLKNANIDLGNQVGALKGAVIGFKELECNLKDYVQESGKGLHDVVNEINENFKKTSRVLDKNIEYLHKINWENIKDLLKSDFAHRTINKTTIEELLEELEIQDQEFAEYLARELGDIDQFLASYDPKKKIISLGKLKIVLRELFSKSCELKKEKLWKSMTVEPSKTQLEAEVMVQQLLSNASSPRKSMPEEKSEDEDNGGQILGNATGDYTPNEASETAKRRVNQNESSTNRKPIKTHEPGSNVRTMDDLMPKAETPPTFEERKRMRAEFEAPLEVGKPSNLTSSIR